MDQARVTAARRFIYGEARLVERRLFAARFEGGDPGAVIDALRGYRNTDGGFGHGLEPDKRVPASQPLDVEVAFETMDAAGLVDDEMVSRACAFLDGLGEGVSCVLPPITEYPHAPHWSESFSGPQLVPMAGLAGYLWKWRIDHPWRERATKFCWGELDGGIPAEAHTVVDVLHFLEHHPDEGATPRLLDGLGDKLGEVQLFHHEASYESYGLTPLHWAPRPDALGAALFPPDRIEGHLDALEAAQQADGGWPITWPTVGPAALAEWRGRETLRALEVLRAYGRLP